MQAAIYTRYSSENQRESSLEDQERLCRQEADRLGYTVTKVYCDAALSGALDETQRPGVQAMLEAAKRREIDVLIVDDTSRLSRDTSDALRTLKRLEYWGVGFVARSDGINTVENPKSARLMFGVKSTFNEEFLRDLAEKTHRGMEGRVRLGLSSGGLPYGYRSEPIINERGQITGHRRVIDGPEAEVVRRIFRLYGDGISVREIAEGLTADGIAPPGSRWPNRPQRVKAWAPSTLNGGRAFNRGILRNSIYVGRPLWNRSRYLLHPDRRTHIHRPRPAEEWIEVPASELRIVPDDLWEKVQQRLALHQVPTSVKGRRNIGHYLLSGFVRCAQCGGAYVKSDHSYRCGIHREYGAQACSNSRGVKVAKLERLVIAALREKLYTPESMKVIIERVRNDLMARARREAQGTRRDEQAKQLRAVESEIEHIKNAVRLGKATESLLEMLEDAERRRKALLAGREPANRSDAPARLERVLGELPKRVQEYLANLETLLTQHQVGRGKDILASLGTEVVISADGTAEIRGDLRKALTLVSSRKESEVLWSGERESNPHHRLGRPELYH